MSQDDKIIIEILLVGAVIGLVVGLFIGRFLISKPSEPIIYGQGDMYIRAQSNPNLLKTKILAVITCYNPVESQCDSNPEITASGKKVREGFIANNCLKFGTSVVIEDKIYVVEDRMNKRYNCRYFDILLFDLKEAREFGRQVKEVEIY